MLGTPRDNALRQRRSDAGQPCDLAHVGTIEVDPLAGKKGTREQRGAPGRFAQAAWLNHGGRLELNITGRRRRRWREEVTDAGTR
ncbi:MAG TPA: hypothetical protein VK573_02910 [Gemmatimonadales bacterium]|nr:hypothetical protein [Gemmatimonadales bacterium]